MDPYSFWERQKDNANVTSPGYSYNSLFGKMIVTVTDAGGHPARSLQRAHAAGLACTPRLSASLSSAPCPLPRHIPTRTRLQISVAS